MGNGGSRKAGELLPHFRRLEEALLTMQGLGLELRDIDAGLVDFPCQRDGRVVYLCWRYGEDAIRFWHDLDAGFAGRRPL